MLTGKKQELADRLFDTGAIKFGAFKLKLHETKPDAPLSPIFLMLRTEYHPTNPGPLDGPAMRLAGELMAEQLQDVRFEAFAGLPEAGEPFAFWVNRVLWEQGKPCERLFLVKEQFDGKRRITGITRKPQYKAWQVALIDDLITQADTKFEGIEVIEKAGLTVSVILVLVDRLQGGVEQLWAAGYQVRSVFTLAELLAHYVKTGRISQDKGDDVMAYVLANRVT